jgi:hypothetical protein
MSTNELDQFRGEIARPASLARSIAGRADPDPFGSWLGRVTALARGAEWPTFEGKPMVGITQLNLRDAPFVPAELEGIGLLALFLAEDDDDGLVVPDGRPNGDGWLLMTCGPEVELIEAKPVQLRGLRPRPIAWELIDDLPAWDDIAMTPEGEAIEALLEDEEYEAAVGSAKEGTKLGGWPSLIQGEVTWSPAGDPAPNVSFCLQFDSDETVGLNLWDSGVIHIGRAVDGGRVIWVAESQFM